MPQRFLRPGITTSQRFNRLTYEAQSFYIRLLTLVDDFGRYDASQMLLRSHAFPLGAPDGKDVAMKTIENICTQLSANDLVMFYSDSGQRELLQVVRWQERPRAVTSKFPAFDNTCKQMFANDLKCSPPSSSSSPSIIVPSSSTIDQIPAVKRRTAKPSCLEDVIEFCEEEGLTESDAKYFFNTKEGNGWRNGKTRVHDWKATVRAWAEAGHLPSTKGRNGSKPESKSIFKQRDEKINELNVRKRDMMREHGDAVYGIKEFEQIEKQLMSL